MALALAKLVSFRNPIPVYRTRLVPTRRRYLYPTSENQHFAFPKCSMVEMASRPVKAAVVQMTSTGDCEANFATCSRLIEEAAAAGAQLACFPENFAFIGKNSGESLQIAEPLDGPLMQRYCSLARKSKIWLSLGGFQEKGPDYAHLRNTHVLIDDNGDIRSKYSKMHLFDVDVPGNMAYKESNFTVAGIEMVVQDSPIGRLGLTVCYDLRFPELYQQLRFQHVAQVLLVPSAFTTITGQAHWEILLRARAIETQCYVIAAAQTGKHNEKRELWRFNDYRSLGNNCCTDSRSSSNWNRCG